MEASLFQEIHDVLEVKSRKIVLPIKYGSPLQKIIWSSFDWSVGPELRFCWEPSYAEPSIYVSNAPIYDSESDHVASTSSKDDDSALQYDEFLQPPTTSLHTAVPSQCSSEDPDIKTCESTLTYSGSAENTATTLNNKYELRDDSPSTEGGHSSYTNVSESEVEDEKIDNDSGENCEKDTALTTSIVDSGIMGTVSVHSDLSATCKSPKLVNANYIPPIDESITSNSDASDYGYCGDKEEADRVESDDDGPSEDPANAAFINASSNIVGLSLLGARLEDGMTLEADGRVFPDPLESSAQDDDEFVAKFALAEQIYKWVTLILLQIFSPQFETNPLIMKVFVVPSRRITICSFLFSSKPNLKTMMAFSVVLSDDMEEWINMREKTFELMFADLITRFKVSYMVEDEPELMCRVTSEIIEVFTLFGLLDRFPLLGTVDTSKNDVCGTFLMDEDVGEEEIKFLRKSITGCLMSQGNCVVIGNDINRVEKTMNTLMLFVTPNERCLCLKPYVFHFNPYLRLQALRRNEVEDLYLAAAECHWPTCFIDVDRKVVTTAGSFFVQRGRKEAVQRFTVAQILKDMNVPLSAEDENRSRHEPSIEPNLVEEDSDFSMLLEALFLSPLDRNERTALVDHLHLNVEYRALALLQLIQELSEPTAEKSSKESAVSSRWSLSLVRKMLGLNSDSAFMISLARADLLKPTFAEFVYQSTKVFR